MPVDVIAFGYGRYGSNLVHRLADAGLNVLVVDWDPRALPVSAQGARVSFVFGDAEDLEFPGTLPLQRARAVVSTIPSTSTSRTLLAALERWKFEGIVAVTAHTASGEARLADSGADLILRPFDDAGSHAAAHLLEQLLADESSSDRALPPRSSLGPGSAAGSVDT